MTYIGSMPKIKNIINLHKEAKKRGHTFKSPGKRRITREEIIYMGDNKFIRLKDNKAELFEDKLLAEIAVKFSEIKDIELKRNILRYVIKLKNSKL